MVASSSSSAADTVHVAKGDGDGYRHQEMRVVRILTSVWHASPIFLPLRFSVHGGKPCLRIGSSFLFGIELAFHRAERQQQQTGDAEREGGA